MITHQGEVRAGQVTPGNTDDRRPVPTRAERVWGHLLADKGDLSQPLTRELLHTRQLRLVPHVKRTMANRVLLLHEQVIRRRRALVEAVVDQLKHLLQVEHTRQRRPTNVAVNLLAGVVAYCHQPNKPSIYRGGRPQLMAAIPN